MLQIILAQGSRSNAESFLYILLNYFESTKLEESKCKPQILVPLQCKKRPIQRGRAISCFTGC